MPIVLGIIGGLLLVALVWVLVNYNRFARLRQHIRESWSDIDVELKRRYELIPNLVETVKGYASHERALFEEVASRRAAAMANHGRAASQAADESAMLLALGRLFAVAEAYPTLKADAGFLALQKELSITEDRIAASRRFYNANVREMTQLCETIPTNVLARIFGFEGGDYFELDSEAQRVVPRVLLDR